MRAHFIKMLKTHWCWSDTGFLIAVVRKGTPLRLAHIVAADNPRKATDVKITKCWRQNDGKRGKARFADGWERPSATTRRQGTNGCGRERSLATKIGRCLGGEWRCLDGARQQGTRSDWLAADWLAARNGGWRWVAATMTWLSGRHQSLCVCGVV